MSKNGRAERTTGQHFYTLPSLIGGACELAIAAVVARQLWLHALEMRRAVAAPFQFDYEEGNILNALARIAHGLSPYPDPHAFPNVLNPYGPLAYYSLAIPVKTFGISFSGPRVMIATGAALVCVFLALLLRRLTGSSLLALAYGLIYASLGLVRGWSALLRVDLPALALAAAGLYAFSRAPLAAGQWWLPLPAPAAGPGKSSRLWMTAAVALFAAALLVKPTFLAAPGACFVWLLLRREWRQAASFGASVAALFAGAFAAAMALTRGTIFTHMFRTHADPFSWQVYGYRMAGMVAEHRVLAVLAGIYLVADLLGRRISVPMLWLLLATATAATAGKLGSGWNHFLEWPAALCLCAGLGWDALRRNMAQAPAMIAAVALSGWLAVFVWQQAPPMDTFAETEQCPAAYAWVRQQASDRILSENVGALVLAGKKVWVSNPFVYSQLVMRAGWKDDLARVLEERGFDVILASRDYRGYPVYRSSGAERFSAAAVEAMAKNYRVVKKFACKDAAVIMEPN